MKAQIHNYASWINKTEPKWLDNYFTKLLNDAGFNILNKSENHFKPQGYTVLYLLSESHLAIHTFPECKETYIELSSCVKKPFDNFIKNLNNL